jgi:adenylylsulfate kinase
VQKPTFVIMAGLPGTGKSTLARKLAAELNGAVLDKDLLRGALFGEAWIEYSREQDDFCVDLLLQAGSYLASREEPPMFIFIDGRPFALRDQRDHVAEGAAKSGCGIKLIHLICSDEIARERLSRGHIAKNRDFSLYQQVKEMFEPIETAHLTLNTDGGLSNALLAQSSRYLRGE